jgi:hypothetical protein
MPADRTGRRRLGMEGNSQVRRAMARPLRHIHVIHLGHIA